MEEDKKTFWEKFKEVFAKTWKWIVAAILLIFGIKAVSKDNDKKDAKKEAKDLKKEIKEENKQIEKEIKEVEKKEEELSNDLQEVKDKIDKIEKEKKENTDIHQFLPDLEKE